MSSNMVSSMQIYSFFGTQADFGISQSRNVRIYERRKAGMKKCVVYVVLLRSGKKWANGEKGSLSRLLKPSASR